MMTRYYYLGLYTEKWDFGLEMSVALLNNFKYLVTGCLFIALMEVIFADYYFYQSIIS